jgi:hypothetical protein
MTPKKEEIDFLAATLQIFGDVTGLETNSKAKWPQLELGALILITSSKIFRLCTQIFQ